MDTLASKFCMCTNGLHEAITACDRPFPYAICIAPSVVIMSKHLKGKADVFSRCQKNMNAMGIR